MRHNARGVIVSLRAKGRGAITFGMWTVEMKTYGYARWAIAPTISETGDMPFGPVVGQRIQPDGLSGNPNGLPAFCAHAVNGVNGGQETNNFR